MSETGGACKLVQNVPSLTEQMCRRCFALSWGCRREGAVPAALVTRLSDPPVRTGSSTDQ